ncbi:hypothetical protein ACA910_002021 [Epithemia clementina (nom. ined.)]
MTTASPPQGLAFDGRRRCKPAAMPGTTTNAVALVVVAVAFLVLSLVAPPGFGVTAAADADASSSCHHSKNHPSIKCLSSSSPLVASSSNAGVTATGATTSATKTKTTKIKKKKTRIKQSNSTIGSAVNVGEGGQSDSFSKEQKGDNVMLLSTRSKAVSGLTDDTTADLETEEATPDDAGKYTRYQDSDSRRATTNATTTATIEKKNPKQRQMKTTVLSASESVRRIQKEWQDVVEAGMGYDWAQQRPVMVQRAQDDDDGNNENYEKQQTQPQPQYVWIGPLHRRNLRTWHFSFVGVPASPYEQGIYHGRLRLPWDYPYGPPQVQVWTPSGRFHIRTDICLSASAFHPETWNAATWTIRTLIESLRLHMLTEGQEIGGIRSCSNVQRQALARQSQSWKSAIGVVVAKHNTKKTKLQSNHHFNNKPEADTRAIWVDHARMIQQGLFPMVETSQDSDGSSSCRNDHEDPQVLLDGWNQHQNAPVSEHDDVQVARRNIPLPLLLLQRFFKKHARLALWGFFLLFVALNRPR